MPGLLPEMAARDHTAIVVAGAGCLFLEGPGEEKFSHERPKPVDISQCVYQQQLPHHVVTTPKAGVFRIRLAGFRTVRSRLQCRATAQSFVVATFSAMALSSPCCVFRPGHTSRSPFCTPAGLNRSTLAREEDGCRFCWSICSDLLSIISGRRKPAQHL